MKIVKNSAIMEADQFILSGETIVEGKTFVGFPILRDENGYYCEIAGDTPNSANIRVNPTDHIITAELTPDGPKEFIKVTNEEFLDKFTPVLDIDWSLFKRGPSDKIQNTGDEVNTTLPEDIKANE